MAGINFSSLDSMIGGFNKILKLQTVGSPTSVPSPLIIIGAKQRSGLSATKIASRIITRKSEAGLPVGTLPSGGVAPDEIMERIRIEEIIKAIQQEMVITVAIPPGTTVTSSGGNAGGPIVTIGQTITITTAYAIAQ